MNVSKAQLRILTSQILLFCETCGNFTRELQLTNLTHYEEQLQNQKLYRKIRSMLELINSDLDAERSDHRLQTQMDGKRTCDDRLKKRIQEKNNQSNHLQIEDETWKFETETSGTSAIINQEKQQLDNQNDNKHINIKAEDTEHMKIYERIIKILYYVGQLAGLDISYHWKASRSIVFWCTCILLLGFSWFNLTFTQYVHYKNGDYIRVLEPFAVYGLAISMIQKIGRHLQRFQQIFSMVFSTRTLCKQHVVGIRADIMKNGLVKTFIFVKVYVGGVLVSLMCSILVPAKVFFVNNEWMTLVPMQIVFLDQSTFSGFIATNVVQVLMGGYGVIGTVFHATLFIAIICNYVLRVDLIGQDFKDLDEMWCGTNKISVAYKQKFLKNIFKKRQDLNHYMASVKEIYEMKLFVYFCFNYFSQIVCLFEIEKNDWLAGYALAMVLFIEMAFYCIMGTQMIIANEKLCDKICDTNWYMYDLQSQKMIQLFIHDCQHAAKLELGSIGPLNVVTGIAILKSIYSYYAILKEVL